MTAVRYRYKLGDGWGYLCAINLFLFQEIGPHVAFIATIVTSNLFVGWFRWRSTAIGFAFAFKMDKSLSRTWSARSPQPYLVIIPTKVFREGAMGSREIVSHNACKDSRILVMKQHTNTSVVAFLPQETSCFWRETEFVFSKATHKTLWAIRQIHGSLEHLPKWGNVVRYTQFMQPVKAIG